MNGNSSNKAGPFAPSSSNYNNGIQKTQTAQQQQLTAKTALVRKVSGGIKVNTVKRAIVPSRSSPLSLPPSNGAAPRINGLSAERMQRVEEIKRERERKKREEEERLRPTKAKTASTPAPAKRRKVVKESSDDDDLFSTGSETSSKKRRKQKASSFAPQASSVGQGYKKLGRSGVLPLYLVPRPLHDEDVFRNTSTPQVQAIQSAALVEGKQYGPFFSNLSEEQSKVQLEYPAPGCSEEFSLLVPKDREEYDPIYDLLRTVRCIIEFYLTPEQQEMFGSLDALETASAATHALAAANKGVNTSREPSVFGSEGTFSASNSLIPASPAAFGDSPGPTTPGRLSGQQSSPKAISSAPISPANFSAIVGTASIDSPYATDSPAPHSAMANTDSILRSFTKARNRRDGLLFLRTADRFNSALRTLRDAGKIEENVAKMGQTGVPEGIWRCVQEQCYARTVAPRVEQLSKYEAFSDNVYGELLPRFMSEIAQLTKLGPESVFADLGSGVGNLLIQVALQTGSEVHGCEQMQVPSELASLQVEEARRRWKMWGLRGGEAKSWQGDFGDDDQIRQVLRRADVILVNNYAFTAPTNDRLSWQFLDLKDGAQVVSLKPFVPPDFRLTERTLSSPLAILRVAQRTYTTGCVSWADGGGKYYIHTVDRSMIAAFLDARDAGAHAKGDIRKKQWKAANESEEDKEE